MKLVTRFATLAALATTVCVTPGMAGAADGPSGSVTPGGAMVLVARAINGCFSDPVRVTGFIVPRPDLLKRAYMLKPLFDIAPDVQHPSERKTIAQLWEGFDQGEHELMEVGALMRE